jgi:transposase-like protein
MSHSKKKPSKPKPEPSTQVPEPEVVAVATKRRFSKAYKLRILEEADRCTQPGEIGALLRREGLYSSHLTGWRKWRKRLKKEQASATETLSDESKLLALQLENQALRARLERAEMIIDVQKKLSRLLGLKTETTNDGSR